MKKGFIICDSCGIKHRESEAHFQHVEKKHPERAFWIMDQETFSYMWKRFLDSITQALN